jgi:hypothetical protein
MVLNIPSRRIARHFDTGMGMWHDSDGKCCRPSRQYCFLYLNFGHMISSCFGSAKRGYNSSINTPFPPVARYSPESITL